MYEQGWGMICQLVPVPIIYPDSQSFPPKNENEKILTYPDSQAYNNPPEAYNNLTEAYNNLPEAYNNLMEKEEILLCVLEMMVHFYLI